MEENDPVSENRFLINYVEDTDSDGKPFFIGLPASKIFKQMQKYSKGWPKAVGDQIYWIDRGMIRRFDKANKLFSWMAEMEITVDWKAKASNSISREVFFEYLSLKVPRYDSIETIPHHPPIKTVYYEIPPAPEANYLGALTKLLNYFKPATPYDLIYLKAMFLTPMWGGGGGSRPAFVLLGPENDTEGGRGVGKTTITDVMAYLYGPAVDLSSDNKRDDITKRLLTTASKRLIRVDNVKDKIGGESFESLITSKYISGHKMFTGDHLIPNYYTWIITYNMPEFSKDMSQRAIPIRLGRPRKNPMWLKEVTAFVESHRVHILHDCLRILKERPLCDLDDHIRFAEWSESVLSRCTNKSDITEDILKRQQMVEDEMPLSDQFLEIIEARLSQYRFIEGHHEAKLNLNGAAYRIKQALVTNWIMEEIKGISARQIIKTLRIDRPEWLNIPSGDVMVKDGGRVILGPVSDGVRCFELGTENVLRAWFIDQDYRHDNRVSKTKPSLSVVKT